MFKFSSFNCSGCKDLSCNYISMYMSLNQLCSILATLAASKFVYRLVLTPRKFQRRQARTRISLCITETDPNINQVLHLVLKLSRFCYWPMKEIQKSCMVASMNFSPGNWSCGNITVTMKHDNTFYKYEKVFIWPSTNTFTGSFWQNFNIRGFKRLGYLLKLANLMQKLRIYIECTLF